MANYNKGEDCVFFKHGGSKRNERNHQSQIYATWVRMRSRCNTPTNHDFKYYGGRGIKICKRWDSFSNFFEDMNESFIAHLKNNSSTTLDRIDTEKGYSPKNCRWATREEQSNNRRFNRLISYKGKTMTASMWSKKIPVKISGIVLYTRVFMRGWEVERAMTQPPRKLRVLRKD